MTIYAFKDDADGYYQVELAEGEEFPAWTIDMTQTEVLPLQVLIQVNPNETS